MTSEIEEINSAKIIIIDDDQIYSNALKFRAMSLGYKAETAASLQDAITQIQVAVMCEEPFSIAIVDMKFEISNIEQRLGKDIIKYLKEYHPNIACILSSAEPPSTLELQDLQDLYNLDYCLPKHDIEPDTLSKAIKRALKHAASNQTLKVAEPIKNANKLTHQKAILTTETAIKSEPSRSLEPPKVFISYSHRDETFKDELMTMLVSLERLSLIRIWQDRQIEAGDEWFDAIQKALNECNIALLLVSGYFLSSRFIQDHELPNLLERRKNSGLRVIPIIVRECLWQREPILKDLQALPKNGKPINSFSKRDQAWTEVAKAIENLATKMA
jgi:hypothetical protein